MNVRTQTRDRVLEDAVKQSPVDVEQAAIHRKLLYLAAPWLALVVPPWLLSSFVARYAKR
jgi:hypothetical protein